MNTTRTSLGRTHLLSLITLLALASGCATRQRPIRGGVTELALKPSALVVHAPREPRAKALLPREAAVRWVTEVDAPAKAKELVETPAAPATDAPAKAACPRADARVLLIGDSLGAGLGPHMARRAAACGTVFFHHGVVGSHVTEWAQNSWLMPQLGRAKPNIVIVSLGGNDFVRSDEANVSRGIARFVERVRASGARLLWISPPSMPFRDKIGVRQLWQQELAGEMNVDWYPTETLTIPRSSDRVHPTIPGYDALSQTLWSWMSAVAQ